MVKKREVERAHHRVKLRARDGKVMKAMMPYPVINLEETGRNIRNMILERDMSVADISRFLGINRSSVYKVIRGEAVFSLDNMFALSVLLDTSVNDIIVVR